jgi:hypothetical protein
MNTPCVPFAPVGFIQSPRGLAAPRWNVREQDPPLSRNDCVTERSWYSIRPNKGSPLGLTFGYERFQAAHGDSGSSLASQRLTDQRPVVATGLDLSDEIYGDEG